MFVKDKEIRIQKFTTTKGLEVGARLLPKLGSALSPLFEKDELGEVDKSKLILSLLQALDHETMTWFCEQCFPSTQVKLTTNATKWTTMNRPLFDAIFEDDYMSVWTWLRSCFEKNYARFLADLGVVVQDDGAEKGQ